MTFEASKFTLNKSRLLLVRLCLLTSLSLAARGKRALLAHREELKTATREGKSSLDLCLKSPEVVSVVAVSLTTSVVAACVLGNKRVRIEAFAHTQTHTHFARSIR